MKYYGAAAIHDNIQAIVGPSVKVQLPLGDMEHLLTLEGEHLELGISQAALSQLRYFNAKPEQQAALSCRIAERIEQIAMKKKQLEKQQYGDYWSSDLLSDNQIVKLHDCYICKDTGWVCDYGSKRYACDCKKGIEKKEPLKNDVHYKLTLGVSKPPQIELPIELPEVVGRRFRGVK